MDFNLTPEDVEKLLRDPSSENRAATAAKIGQGFEADHLNDRERQLAEDIFRIMVRDAEIRVRKALAQSLKDNPDLPRDVAMSMAQDVADVAVPVLEASTVLTPEDLIEVVRTQAAEHQMAVARRPDVTESVADALVETDNEDVVAILVANERAEINENTMHQVFERFGELETVNEPLAQRRELPVSIVERLVTVVSETIRDQLVMYHDVSPDLASDLVMESRERATLGLLNEENVDLGELVAELHGNRRLTPTLITRALCMGDMPFFEASLAELAGIPVANAYTLIHDKGELGLTSLLKRCNFPISLIEICRAAVRVAEETDYDGRPNDRQRFRERMIERILTLVDEDLDPENLDYFISKLGGGGGFVRPHA